MPRLAATLVLAGAGASGLVACGPATDCSHDHEVLFSGTTAVPVDEPIAWIVTLCLDEDCSTLDVDSEVTEVPDVTGTLFTRFAIGRQDAVWGFGGTTAFGSRTGDIRLSLAIHDRASGELVVSAAIDHRPDEDHLCLAFGIHVSDRDDAGPT